jgi:hypothetical protein
VHPTSFSQLVWLPATAHGCGVPMHSEQSALVQHSPPLLQTPPQQIPPEQAVMSAMFGLLHVPLPEQVLLVQGFPSLQSLFVQHALQPLLQQLGVEPPHVSVHVPHAQELVHVRVPVQVVPDGVHDPVSPS